MRTDIFDYYLPEELIAQFPIEKRDESRLLVVSKKKNSLEDKVFKEVSAFFQDGDLLMMNNSQVFPARLKGYKKETGLPIEIFLLRRLNQNSYETLVRPGKRLKIGTKVIIEKDGIEIEGFIEKETPLGRIVIFNRNVDEWLPLVGEIPLPPYIKREPDKNDKIRYQTVYAREPGSVAAPTAGLHFTEELLEEIQKRGVNVSYLTLHVGPGTFKPVKTEIIKDHQMDREYFTISGETLKKIKKAKEEKRRIVAIGTTTTRVLESLPDLSSPIFQMNFYSDSTDIFIYPPYQFRYVDMLITNFHLPKSTLIMLVSAFGGIELIKEAYKRGVNERYRFYSYGDAMLIQE